jgi:hypothetical protein
MFHELHSGSFVEATGASLRNMPFVAAKIQAGKIYELLEDYSQVCPSFPLPFPSPYPLNIHVGRKRDRNASPEKRETLGRDETLPPFRAQLFTCFNQRLQSFLSARSQLP